MGIVLATAGNHKKWTLFRITVQVTTHGIIRYVTYGFLLVCYSNLSIRDLRFSTWPWNSGYGHSRSLESTWI